MDRLLRHVFYLFVGAAVIGLAVTFYFLLKDVVNFKWVGAVTFALFMSYLVGAVVVQLPLLYKEERALNKTYAKLKEKE